MFKHLLFFLLVLITFGNECILMSFSDCSSVFLVELELVLGVVRIILRIRRLLIVLND